MPSPFDDINGNSDDEEIFIKKRTVRNKFVDSDDENNSVHESLKSSQDVTTGRPNEDVQTNQDESDNSVDSIPLIKKSKKKRRVIQKNDSESEEDGEKPTLTPDDDLNLKSDSDSSSNDASRVNSNDVEDELTPAEKSQQCKSLFANKDLYDAESSDEERTQNTFVSNDQSYEEHESHYEGSPAVKGRKGEKTAKSRTAPKPERKSKTAAKSELEHIRSETQRMVRETRVSLPYHRPKQRSLEEFLQRKTSGSTGRRSLKMSSEELVLMEQTLEKRAKEAEIFYKSDSEESEIQDTEVESSLQTSDAVAVANDALQGQCSDTAAADLSKDVDSTVSSSDLTCAVEPEKLENTSIQSSSLKIDDNHLNTKEPEVNVAVNEHINIASNSEVACQNVDSKPTQTAHNSTLSSLNFSESDNSLPCREDKGALSNGNIYDSDEIDSQNLHLHYSNTETLDFLTDSEKVIANKDPGSSLLRLSNTVNEKLSCNNGDETQDTLLSSKSLNLDKNEEGLVVGRDSGSIDKVKDNDGSKYLEAVDIVTEKIDVTHSKENDENSPLETIYKVAKVNDQSLSSETIHEVAKVHEESLSSGTIHEVAKVHVESLSSGTIHEVAKVHEESLSSETIHKVAKVHEESLSSETIHKVAKVHDKSSSSDTTHTIAEVSGESLSSKTTHEVSTVNDERSSSKTILEVTKINDEVSSSETILKGANVNVECSSLEAVHKTVTDNCANDSSNLEHKIVKENDSVSSETVPVVVKENNGDTLVEKLPSVVRLLNFDLPSDSEDEADVNSLDKGSDPKMPNLRFEEEMLTSSAKLLSDFHKLAYANLELIPRLSVGPNEMVDLDATPSPRGVQELMNRFMKHSVKKKPIKEKERVELSIVTAEKGKDGLEEVRKETVTVVLGGEEELQEDPALAKPGAKLQRLKQELQQQMSKRREEEWNRRQRDQRLDDEEIGDDDDLLDDEKEEKDCEFTETESEEEEGDEEEEEEEDITLTDKPRIRSTFVDDEVDVSEDDGISSDDTEEETERAAVKHVPNADKPQAKEIPTRLERMRTFDIFGSQDAVDSEDADGYSVMDDSDCGLSVSVIPPYQPGGALTQISQSPVEKESVLSSLNKPTIFKGITADKTSTLPSKLTLLNHGELPQHPFSSVSQSTGSKLGDLCNGVGNGTTTPSTTQVEQELLGLCSGKFSSQPFDSQDDSQNLHLSLSEDSVSQPCLTKNSTTAQWPSRTLASSDEEDISFDNPKRLTKKKRMSNRKLTFSDDEDSNLCDVTSEEDDDDDDDDGGDGDGDLSKVVDYDSEENEIVAIEQEQKKEARARATKEFFENEAELSESEWGSADEDEKDLDTLEWEEGDEEQLNEHQLKEQVGKIHMRQVLDEDQREVRQLQELLLEDGELHSDTGGRQRQFRWKNINNMDGISLENRGLSDDEGLDDVEEEDEEQWRRTRFEREKILLEQKAKEAEGGEVMNEDSQLLQLGKAALKRTISTHSNLKSPHTVTKRGSFLARGESALARIAQITRGVTETAVVGGPKNSRNFVFAVISPEKKNNSIKEGPVKVSKRKSVEATPPVIKKLRLSDGNTRGRCLLDQLGY